MVRQAVELTSIHGARDMPDNEPVTLINVFEVAAADVDAFLVQWRERAKVMAAAPGFRDSTLHRAMSSDARFQLVNVAHWDSQEALAAAQANPEFRSRVQATTTRSSANPAVYQVEVTL
jgi:heme-degrading monooxygenase HmoA